MDGDILAMKISRFNFMGVMEGSEMCWEEDKVIFRTIVGYAISDDGLGGGLAVVRRGEEIRGLTLT